MPFAKERLAVDDAVLGLLLLSLGIGSVVAMTATGILSARHGTKPIIIAGGIGLALVLPLLVVAATPLTLALALLGFGAALGSIDVAMNIHAVEVERAAGQPLMSGFHALFSIGGFAGSAVMTALLSLRGPLGRTLFCSALMLRDGARMASPAGRTQAKEGLLFVMPHGIVLLLAGLAATSFLTEGAILDWGALLVTGTGLHRGQGGIGYIVFSVAMTAGRLVGDGVAARIGDRTTLVGGSLLSVAGLAVLLLAPSKAVAIAGFLLIGLGASNLVPVLFRGAATQTAMPTGLAVASITTAGYAGVLVGPAGIGFVAHAVGLPMAFWMLAALMRLVTLSARAVTKK